MIVGGPFSEAYWALPLKKSCDYFFRFTFRATQKFLNQLQVVAESHNFFNPGFTPKEMDELPDLYRSVINDPAFLHDAFVNAQGMIQWG